MSREDFEKWAGADFETKKFPSGNYYHEDTQYAWLGWLACETKQAQRIAEIKQAITDEENQPSQYGTVPLAWYEKQAIKYSDLADNFVLAKEAIAELEAQNKELVEALELCKVTFIANNWDVRNVMEIINEALAKVKGE